MRALWSIRSLLYFVLAVLLIPPSLLLTFSIYKRYQDQIDSIHTRSLALARVSASEIVELINDARYILDSLERQPRIRALAPDQCAQLFYDLKLWHTKFANLTTVDRSGQGICNSAIASGQDLPNYSQREWFAKIVGGSSFVVGSPVIGLSHQLWIVPLARSINDENGNMIGALSLSIDLARFRPRPVREDVPAGTEISVLDSNGTYLAHSSEPESEAWLGRPFPDPQFLTMMAGNNSGAAMPAHYRGADNIKRIAGLAQVPGTDWQVIAAVPMDPIIASARNDLIVNIGAVVLVLTAAAGAAAFGIRKIEKPVLSIARTAQAHLSGNVAMRAEEDGPREIATVARQFNAMLDVQERNERKLVQQKIQLDEALNNMSQGLAMFDSEARLVIFNEHYKRTIGITSGKLKPGLTFREVLDLRMEAGTFAGDPDQYTADVLGMIAQGKTHIRQIEYPDGRMIQNVRQPMPGGGWVVTQEDITERKRAEEHIAYLAHHDALTDLPNRLQFHAQLEQGLKWAHRGEQLAVLCLDLDNFKNINDTLGHPVGDELLKAVAERLRGCIRETDTVARLGGDEFAIIQTGIEQPLDAATLAMRISDAIIAPYNLVHHQVIVGTSIGIAISPNDGSTADELMRNADLALYGAKSSGRRTFRFFEPDMNARMVARHILESDLRKALADGELALHYQPQVNLARNEVSGCEALLRWHHPERGMISPDAFISVAEETGLIVPLGEWVLRQACAEAATWPDDIVVAVNLSPIQLTGSNIVGLVIGALAASGLAAHRLELEITEAVLLHNSEATLAILRQLREVGVRIALDDFGTGYSSLSYLCSFPFDKIKIDRSFINDLANRDDSVAIVQAITGLASRLAIATTAEGVETQKQLDIVRALGCTEMQGYLFSRPQPIEEIARLFLTRAKSVVSAA